MFLMETITINREFLNKIKANYLHYQREEENLSIYFTAESLHINRGTLFRIESGSLQISDDLFFTLLNFYDSYFSENVQSLHIVKQYIQRIFTAYCDFNYKKAGQLYDTFISQKSINHDTIDSYDFFHVMLLDFLNDILINKKMNEKALQLLNEYHSVFSDDEICILHILCAKHFCDKEAYQEALSHLNELNRYNQNENTIYYALDCYLRASICLRENQGFSTYRYTQKALDILNETLYFERIKFLKMYQAIALSLLKQYEEAELLYFNLIDAFEGKDQKFVCAIRDNLAWLYIQSGQYQQAITATHQAFQAGSDFFELYFNIPLACYFLHDNEQCLQEIGNIPAEKKDPYTKAFLDVLQNGIIGDNVQFEWSVSHFLKQAENRNNPEMIRITLKIAAEYFETKDLERTVYYQKQLIALN